MSTYRRSLWPRASSFRFVALGGVAAIAAAGLTVRYLRDDIIGKYAGIALYAALVYAVVVMLVPRVRPKVAAAVTLVFCWTVELAQLTPYPAQLSERNTASRLVLGSTFNAPDLAWYAVGVAAMFAVHTVAYRKARTGVSLGFLRTR